MNRKWTYAVAISFAATSSVLLVDVPSAVAQTNQYGMENALLGIINSFRANKKLPRLLMNPTLRRVAQQHAYRMARDERLEHTLAGKSPQQRVRDSGYGGSYAGENIAYNYSSRNPVGNAFSLWLNSADHNRNMFTTSANEAGVGVYKSGTGRYYYCLVLGARNAGDSGPGKQFPKMMLFTVSNQTPYGVRLIVRGNNGNTIYYSLGSNRRRQFRTPLGTSARIYVQPADTFGDYRWSQFSKAIRSVAPRNVIYGGYYTIRYHAENGRRPAASFVPSYGS